MAPTREEEDDDDVHSERASGEEDVEDEDDVERLVFLREEARLKKNFEGADELRDRLVAMGVTLLDRERQWKSEDGRSGRIPTFEDVKKGRQSSRVVKEEQRDEEMEDEELRIREIIRQREAARKSRDYAESDRLRSDLKQLGVEVEDKAKIWIQSSTGLEGCIIGYANDKGTATDMEIDVLIRQREKARMNNDWKRSDMIRDELKRAGVHIQDREKTFNTTDGRRGNIPAWDDLQEGGAQGSSSASTAPPPPAPVPTTAPPPPVLSVAAPLPPPSYAQPAAPSIHEVYALADLQRQVVDAAMVATRTMEAANKALSFLRQLIAEQNIPYSPPPPLPIHPVPTAAPPPALPPALPPAAPTPQPPQPAYGRALPPAPPSHASSSGPYSGNAPDRGQKRGMGDTGDRAAKVDRGGVDRGNRVVDQGQKADRMRGAPPPPAPPPKAPAVDNGRSSAPKSEELVMALDHINKIVDARRPPSDDDISWLIEMRERLRFNKDFAGSDELRQALKQNLRIDVHEKEKRWTMNDGRSGGIPSWDSLFAR
eukprot:TRINITY_DN42083_c0_g1_i1.p1 TRINITY_DN42083_c0_g1~~TRINITY_DN42083_c0_g1_i1.p1  ORF type:complete len:541 (+),score=142.77 TRINITY_DN42083_c0_g1_i1:120-1742(+)